MTATAQGRGASRWLMVLIACSAVLAPRLAAAEPEIRNLNIHGLQSGATTTLLIAGEALGTGPCLLLPFHSQQKLRPGATDKSATFDVKLRDVPPGYYHLRVVTDGGASLPVVIAVDRLPQRPLAASVDQLPVALHGAVDGSTVVETRFPGKAGQKVLVEVEAQRLGSKLRPILHLYSPRRLQLAWSWTTPALAGDARLEATLPEDGPYTIAIHDAEYAAAAPSFFRLRVGKWSLDDQVFPPVVGTGQRSVELLGLPVPIPVDLPALQDATVLPLAWPREGIWSGPRPFVRISSRPEKVVQATADKVQELPAGPVGVSGRLLKPFAEDRYRISVKPGDKLRFEVFAERYGSPLDAALVVRNEKGGELARAEDGPGTLDPVLDYTVPANLTALVVGVVDAQGRGGPRGVYRLTIDPQSPGAAKADFRLVTPAQRLALSVGGRAVLPVWVERRGYQGSIALSAEGLPAGVKPEGGDIPPEADGALVTVRRGEAPADAAITHWQGRGTDGREHAVLLKGHPLEQLQPWLAREIAVAPTTARAADFQVDWRNLPADAGLVPAGRLVLPVKLIRPATNAVVRLGLLTSQLPPLVNNQLDPNQALRPEKAVELPAKATDSELAVLIPPQLTAPVYDVTVQAELLSADKKIVLAVAQAPVRRLLVRMPLVVQLTGPGRIEAKRDPKMGTTFQVKGKVERREGLSGDVALSLTGLPTGGRANPVTVKAGATIFTLDVVLPANLAPGELKGLKLFGTAAPDPKKPNVRVRSREVAVTLVVQAPGS